MIFKSWNTKKIIKEKKSRNYIVLSIRITSKNHVLPNVRLKEKGRKFSDDIFLKFQISYSSS